MKNKHLFIPIFSVLLAGVVAGWYLNSKTSSEKTQPLEIVTIIKKLPIGSSFEDVKLLYPNLSDLQGQGGYLTPDKTDLTEAHVHTELMGLPAEIEFNFQKDNLYSYFFNFNRLDKKTADKLFADLTETFQIYGKPQPQTMEPNRPDCYTNFWQTPDFSVGLSKTTSDQNLYYVSAGYQTNEIQQP